MKWKHEIKAVVLAAGSGWRIGRPKAFLDLGGHTFVEEIARRLLDCGLSRIGIVTTLQQYDDLQQLDLPHTEFVINFTPEQGQFSSIRLAVISADREVKGLMFIPVDHPAVRSETYSALIRAWIDTGKDKTIIPAFGRQTGHPIVVSVRLFPSIINAPPDSTLRDLLRHEQETIHVIDVDDKGVILNVNTPEDHRRLLSFIKKSPEP